MASMHHTTNHGTILSANDIFMNVSKRPMSPVPMPPSSVGPKSNAKLPHAMSASTLAAPALLKRFSTKIADFMNKEEYKDYIGEVKDFLAAHGGPHKGIELSMFRTLFMKEMELDIQLPVAFDNPKKCVVSKDSAFLAVWSTSELSMISVVRKEVLFTVNQFDGIMGVFISPDSLFFVVAERSNIRIFSMIDQKECFNLVAHGAMSINPFEAVDLVQKNNVEFSRIKFSFFEAIEEVHPDRTSIGEGEKLKYKLIIGDRTLIYVLDIKVMDIGVKFVVDAGLDTYNLQDYYLIDSAEYIFTYQDEADKEKYVVAITESKGDTRFRRYLLTADYSDARDEKGNHNKVKLKVDLEHLFIGSMTFQHADSSPFRTGNHTVLVFNTDTKAVYICMLSTPFGFVGAAGTHTLSQVMIGFSKKDFRQLIINQKGDHLVSNHDDWELNVWRKDQEWGHYFTDRSSSDEFTMFMTPDDHFLIMKSKEGLKFLPLGFEKKERNTQVWLPDTMDNMLEKHYFRYVNSDNIIVFDTSSAFLTNFANNKHQFKHMLDPRLELTNPRIEDICAIRGTNEYWILIKEDSFAGSYYKLFLYNSSTGVTQESKAQILSLTVKITFNFDGRFVYLGDGQDGALSQVDTVRVFAYDDMKELNDKYLTCKCVAINSTLYVIKQDKVKIVNLETLVVSEEIDTKFALYDVGLATKTYPELDYIIIYDFASLSLFDTAKNQFTGAIKFEGQNNHKSPFKNELLAVTKDKQFLIAADQFTGNVMFYSLPDFIEQYNICVDPFDFLCVSPDSNYVFMADEFNKVILVYSISEMQVRTKISTQFEFLWTGTNLQYVGFEENTHSLALYYQRQNCVTQVLVPFSYTMIFNAFFRIYPLFLRFFGTDSYRAKEALMSEILLILENSNSYVPQLLQVFTIAIYLLDQPGFFKRYAEKFLSVDELCEKHNIWRLVFNTYKVNSVQCFKEMLTEYIVKNQRFPYIDEMSVREFILERNIYLNNTLYRWLLQKILFWRMDEEILGELNNPTTTVAYLEQSASKSDATRRAIQSLLKKQPNNLITFNSTETLVGLDFGNGSEFSATFFDIVDGLPESDIRDYYYVFVQYKWNKIYKFALIYSIVYWMMNIMAYIFNGFYFQVIPLGISLSVMNILFLLFELKCAMADYRRFFSSPWNWIDLTIHTFSIITIYIILGTSDVNNSMPLAWVRVVTVFVLSFRGITMLRVFKQTRYLISMLLQVLNDVVPFIIVLIFVLLIYIYVWFVIVYYGTDAVDGNTQPNYYDSIQLAVFTFFGQFPTDGLSTFQFVMIAIGSVLLALTLGNFIIALITSTYERISDDRQLFDAKDVIAMISDFDAFLKGIIKRRSHIWKNYVAIFPKYERSEDLRKTIAAIDNSKAQVLNVLEMSNHRYSELESKFNKMQNEVKEQVNLFEARLGEKLEHIHRRVEDALGMTKLSYSIDNFGK